MNDYKYVPSFVGRHNGHSQVAPPGVLNVNHNLHMFDVVDILAFTVGQQLSELVASVARQFVVTSKSETNTRFG